MTSSTPESILTRKDEDPTFQIDPDNLLQFISKYSNTITSESSQHNLRSANEDSQENTDSSVDETSDESSDDSSQCTEFTKDIELDIADVIDSCSLLDGELITNNDVSLTCNDVEDDFWEFSDDSFESSDGEFPLTTSFCRILPREDALPYAQGIKSINDVTAVCATSSPKEDGQDNKPHDVINSNKPNDTKSHHNVKSSPGFVLQNGRRDAGPLSSSQSDSIDKSSLSEKKKEKSDKSKLVKVKTHQHFPTKQNTHQKLPQGLPSPSSLRENLKQDNSVVEDDIIKLHRNTVMSQTLPAQSESKLCGDHLNRPVIPAPDVKRGVSISSLGQYLDKKKKGIKKRFSFVRVNDSLRHKGHESKVESTQINKENEESEDVDKNKTVEIVEPEISLQSLKLTDAEKQQTSPFEEKHLDSLPNPEAKTTRNSPVDEDKAKLHSEKEIKLKVGSKDKKIPNGSKLKEIYRPNITINPQPSDRQDCIMVESQNFHFSDEEESTLDFTNPTSKSLNNEPKEEISFKEFASDTTCNEEFQSFEAKPRKEQKEETITIIPEMVTSNNADRCTRKAEKDIASLETCGNSNKQELNLIESHPKLLEANPRVFEKQKLDRDITSLKEPEVLPDEIDPANTELTSQPPPPIDVKVIHRSSNKVLEGNTRNSFRDKPKEKGGSGASKDFLDAYDDELLAKLLTSGDKPHQRRRRVQQVEKQKTPNSTASSRRSVTPVLSESKTSEKIKDFNNKEASTIQAERLGRPHSQMKDQSAVDPNQDPYLKREPQQMVQNEQPFFHDPIHSNFQSPYQRPQFYPTPSDPYGMARAPLPPPHRFNPPPYMGFPNSREQQNEFHNYPSTEYPPTRPRKEQFYQQGFNTPVQHLRPRYRPPAFNPRYPNPHFDPRTRHSSFNPLPSYSTFEPISVPPRLPDKRDIDEEYSLNPPSMREWLDEIDDSVNMLRADENKFNFRQDVYRDNYDEDYRDFNNRRRGFDRRNEGNIGLQRRGYRDHNQAPSRGLSNHFPPPPRSRWSDPPPYQPHQVSLEDYAAPGRDPLEDNTDHCSYAEFVEEFSRDLRDPRLCVREQNFRCSLMSEIQRLRSLVSWPELLRIHDKTMRRYHDISSMHITAEEKDMESRLLLDSIVREITFDETRESRNQQLQCDPDVAESLYQGEYPYEQATSRAMFCKIWNERGICSYGTACPYVHSCIRCANSHGANYTHPMIECPN